MNQQLNVLDTKTVHDFWMAADKLQAEALSHARELFTFAETADAETLRFLLTQYRYFTIYYVPDLALLIARLEDGLLRSFLSDVLCDELGRGNPRLAHAQLYDDFLASIGVTEEDLDSLGLDSNISLLDRARQSLISPANGSAYCVGLRGMGGECVCQIYIAQLHQHILNNPLIRECTDSIDWRFWDLHVGDHDVEHRVMVRKIINDELLSEAGPEKRQDLGRGFHDSMLAWQAFWNNIFRASATTTTRKRVTRTFEFARAISAGA